MQDPRMRHWGVLVRTEGAASKGRPGSWTNECVPGQGSSGRAGPDREASAPAVGDPPRFRMSATSGSTVVDFGSTGPKKHHDAEIAAGLSGRWRVASRNPAADGPPQRAQ